MAHANRKKLVYTIPDRCRVCYTCVRECPAKAIRIINGQAEVMDERCIGCGNCVKVCSQGAKEFLKLIEPVETLLASEERVAAIVAPSFPAEFNELDDHRVLVGMLKTMGFDYVFEVAFGADMIAKRYKEIYTDKDAKPLISSDCPAIVYYVEHYHPNLVTSLAPIVSPMVATTRIVRKKYGKNLKVVFIGPCIAKKAESDEVDQSITFRELREMFWKKKIMASKVEPVEFDPPWAGRGAIFPISRGLLQTINLSEDFFDGNIVVAEGRADFRDAIKEFEHGLLQSQHLELLCCKGCIMGPGMSPYGKRYARRVMVANYVNHKLQMIHEGTWQKQVEEFSDVDFSQNFTPEERKLRVPSRAEVTKVLHSMGKYAAKDQLNCGACGYETCEEHAIAISQGIAETEMCLPYAISKLHKAIEELGISNDQLASVKQALKQSEKLAHMGQLSAGIAHELNNPLGVIIMYANILLDECKEDNPVRQDLELIVSQTNRCKSIVGNLLNFARKNQVKREGLNVEELVNKSLNSVIIPTHIITSVDSCLKDPVAMLDAEQMMQVLTNLIKNAVEAMPDGGRLSLHLDEEGPNVIMKIKDTGHGIKKEHIDKLFTPFFTTKGIGKGTGLGLATTYGIVKMHKGKISVDSNTGSLNGNSGTTFTIVIPKS